MYLVVNIKVYIQMFEFILYRISYIYLLVNNCEMKVFYVLGNYLEFSPITVTATLRNKLFCPPHPPPLLPKVSLSSLKS